MNLQQQAISDNEHELHSYSPVVSNPKVLGGTLVFRGTRVPAQTLLDYLNDGYTLEQFLEFFPSVSSKDASTFLQLVKYEKGNL